MTPTQERAIKRKIDLAILPYCALLYLLSASDPTRSLLYVNIGQARLANLEKDLHLKGNQYDIALTVFFVSYILVEVPSNLALRWFKPHRWIFFLMVSWSVVMTLMGIVNNFGGLVAARFMLGLAEGGLFPGVNFLLTTWYNRNEQNLVISLFYAGTTLAGAFGGLLAFGIRHMAHVGWQGRFILEGLLTFLCAIPAWWLVPDFPEDHRVLKGIDRERWLHRLAKNQGVTNVPLPFSWRQVRRAFTDWRTYIYALLYLSLSQLFYSLAFFTPTIIKELGFTNANANLLSAPPYVLRVHHLDIGVFIIGGLLMVITGYVILITNASIAVKYFAIFLCVGGISPCGATATTFIGNNYGPVYTRAVAMGFYFAVGACGGIISSNVYPSSAAPRFFAGHGIAIAFAFLGILCVLTLMVANGHENARRDRVYGVVAPIDSGTKGDLGSRELSELQIMELGDRHPGFRYVL
ncbi:hypothetical protein BS47DRAFT_1372468 [Hydnum rufescens UP504]|uniref:Major facilitator superfamily (MFS) profile domain-containing protein n=1 Tax=Hydnum rufescens UP504 TaxID=1448309 RepID=A0A9P6AXL8_9AGAM|nr:hypothetical protein BS47DRAFT_1372468 [Hydnum rufescens UP504]